MKRDFDYVTMDDYAKDTAELTSQAAGIIDMMKEKIKDRERVIRAMIRSNGGRIALSMRDMADLTGLIVAEDDLANDCRVYRLQQ